MEKDINTIREEIIKQLKTDDFALLFYLKALECWNIVFEDYADDRELDGYKRRLFFGNRTGIRIERFENPLYDSSFRFICTYEYISKLENLGDRWPRLDFNEWVYPTFKVRILASSENKEEIEKAKQDEVNVILFLKNHFTHRKYRDDFERLLSSNDKLDSVWLEEVYPRYTESVHIKNRKLLEIW